MVTEDRMHARRWKHLLLQVVLALGILAGPPAAVHAQGTAGPTVLDSKVGYIDSAIPATQYRLRLDAAYGNNRPTRAEFFYARGAPLGPGLPVPEVIE